MARGQSKRRTPLRLCVACRKPAGKRELIRIVRSADGVQVDPGGKMAGRGAYLHPTPTCWSLALESGSIARALKTRLGSEELEQLQAFSRTLSDREPNEPIDRD